MWTIFQSLGQRLKALFATDAARELEAEFLSREAERQASLLRQAQRYDQEGFVGIAQEIRSQVDATKAECPLALVLPALQHLHAETPSYLEDDGMARKFLAEPRNAFHAPDEPKGAQPPRKSARCRGN